MNNKKKTTQLPSTSRSRTKVDRFAGRVFDSPSARLSIEIKHLLINYNYHSTKTIIFSYRFHLAKGFKQVRSGRTQKYVSDENNFINFLCCFLLTKQSSSMLRFITEVLQELLGTISLNIKTNLMWNITGNFPWKTLLLSNATFMHFPQLKVSLFNCLSSRIKGFNNLIIE